MRIVFTVQKLLAFICVWYLFIQIGHYCVYFTPDELLNTLSSTTAIDHIYSITYIFTRVFERLKEDGVCIL